MDELQQAGHKLAEEMYKQAAEGAAAEPGGDGGGEQAGTAEDVSGSDEDVTDADYRVVDDEEK